MKKLNLFSFALAALMLGACSNEFDEAGNGQGIDWNANGKGYVNLAIQLPTQPNTRANDNFDDGTPAEYEVNNATLILFVKGQSDDDYKVNSAYNMNLNFSPEGSTTDNITTTAKITQEINSVSGDIKALVVLNNNGLFSIAAVVEGDYSLQVTYVGYNRLSRQLSLHEDLSVTLKLTPSSHALAEVVVTAHESQGIVSASKINREMMTHLQPTSFTDLLELLPGNISQTPQMGQVNSIHLRETGTLGASGTPVSNSDYSVSSLGTLFVVDGAPINTDANLQMKEIFGARVVGAAADSLQIQINAETAPRKISGGNVLQRHSQQPVKRRRQLGLNVQSLAVNALYFPKPAETFGFESLFSVLPGKPRHAGYCQNNSP